VVESVEPEQATTRSIGAPEWPRILNLGCGKKKLPNALNVDIVPDVEPDLVLDVQRRPWPLPSDWFREIHAYDVLEHTEDVVAFMEEAHRVAADDALLVVTVPHFSSANAFTDPTHRHYFGASSFDYFTGQQAHDHYTRVRFRKEAVEVIFHRTLANKLVHRVAKRFPLEWERRWAWMFPAWFISVRLRVDKSST
jgi:hypothetical protein